MSTFATSQDTPQARRAVAGYLASRGPGEPIHGAVHAVLRLSELGKDVDVRESETHDGWSNRETAMVALYLDNEREWYDAWRAALRATRDRNESDYAANPDAADDEYRAMGPVTAGDVLRELVTVRLDALSYPETRTRDLVLIARDIGSLWRVSWIELGRAFLERLAEEDS